MKKKIVTLLIAGTLALSITACGSESAGSTDNTEKESAAEEAPEEPTDLTGTWKRNTNAGLT